MGLGFNINWLGRYKACLEAGLKEVPVIKVDSLSAEKQREFIIKDNISGGEWDWDLISTDWDYKTLNEWGLDIPGFGMGSDFTEANEYNFQNKVTIEFKTFEDAQLFYEKSLKENLKAKLSWDLNQEMVIMKY